VLSAAKAGLQAMHDGLTWAVIIPTPGVIVGMLRRTKQLQANRQFVSEYFTLLSAS